MSALLDSLMKLADEYAREACRSSGGMDEREELAAALRAALAQPATVAQAMLELPPYPDAHYVAWTGDEKRVLERWVRDLAAKWGVKLAE